MPHYDYFCPQCQHRMESFQKMSDAPLKECPNCHQPTLQRGPGGGTGLLFQGTGFYITDYGPSKSPDKPCTPDKKNSNSGGGSGCPCC